LNDALIGPSIVLSDVTYTERIVDVRRNSCPDHRSGRGIPRRGNPEILGTKTSLRMRDQLKINPQLYRVVGFLEIAAVAGLLIGLVVPVLGAAAVGGLALLMIGAIVSHILGGEAKGSLPAAVLFVASVAAAGLRILSL
jgi:DoxX-like family